MQLLLIIIFLLSWTLTWGIKLYTSTHKIIDNPNNRSSHVTPTPLGGGLAIVLSLALSLPFIYYNNLITFTEIIALGVAGSTIAFIGWLDDNANISIIYRSIMYCLASIWVLYWFDGMPTITLWQWQLSAGLTTNILATLYLTWLINAYNFMDGIDGIAAIEAITTCVGAAIIYWLAGAHSLIAAPLLLAAAVAGFLYWNMPPARIFMGDAGSCFLGLMLGGLSIYAAKLNLIFFWSWLILLSVFITDTTFTLSKRLLAGKKIYQAHRAHAYQHAAQKYSHFKVSISVFIFNIIWLLPLACMVSLNKLTPFYELL